MSQLSAQTLADEKMFCAIVSSAEKRHEPRRAIGAAACLIRIDNGRERERLHVLVRDVCGHGIGLRSPAPLASGEIHRLEIGSPAQGEESGVMIRIIHSRRRHDGTYDVGARCV